MNANEQPTVASIILAQLGGNRFLAMTGAKNLLDHGNALSFRLGRGARDGINYVKVALNADDLYDVEFVRLRGVDSWARGEALAVHAEDLRRVFTDRTGFETSL